MLRIISGELKSRLFKAVPTPRSHPMSDRGKMALFNMLGHLDDVELVLDAYGGSGALAFEALSRGAQRAIIIEINARVYKQLTANVKQLGLQNRVTTYRANNVTCLNNLQRQFDLMFLDPPFDNFREGQSTKTGHLCASRRPFNPQSSATLSFAFQAPQL